jgi:hypothetical protein
MIHSVMIDFDNDDDDDVSILFFIHFSSSHTSHIRTSHPIKNIFVVFSKSKGSRGT